MVDGSGSSPARYTGAVMRVSGLLVGLLVVSGVLVTAPGVAARCARTFVVDGRRGPVVSGSRTIALAGAVTAVAEGAEGALRNPAALANRPLFQGGWLSADLMLGGVFAPFQNMDFDGDGTSAGANTSMYNVNAGLVVQVGGFGFGTGGGVASGGPTIHSGKDTDHSGSVAINASAGIGLGSFGASRRTRNNFGSLVTSFGGVRQIGGAVSGSKLSVVA